MRSRALLAIYGHVNRLPPHAPGGTSPAGAEDLEALEELGDDAIIAQQQGAHVPKPRAQVTEEARSVVISDHPPNGPPSVAPRSHGRKRRSERTEKTVVVRDRRQIEQMRRELARHEARASTPPGKGLGLWVVVGVAAFLLGGLVALIASGGENEAPPVAPAPAQQAAPLQAPNRNEPPSVSIDELPIEESKKR